jgi:hypothetical protein
VTPYADGVSETEPQTAKPNPYLQLAIGVLVFVAVSIAALLAAGGLGAPGVFIAVLLEATAIAGLYRWCAA